MRTIIDTRGVIDNAWVHLGDEQAAGRNPAVIVSSQRLRQEWESLKATGLRLGVELDAADEVDDLSAFLPRLEIVVLNFAVFADGRAFSQARMLRRRYSFDGVIRAQGDVLRDQLSFMQRCGIDQFQLAEGEDVKRALGAFCDFSESYQPAPMSVAC